MSLSEKRVKHFIFVRFFPNKDPRYPHDIFDVDFLSKQLLLAKNCLGSLENQTNKNFELVFLAHKNFFEDKKYKFIFSTLQNSTILPLNFIQRNYMSHLVKAAFNKKYDFVIQSRMDLDDFVYKGAVEDTQSKVDECTAILSYGYCKGYAYISGEVYPHFHLRKGLGHIAILQSMIFKSSVTKNLPFIGPYSMDHVKVKPVLKSFLTRHKIDFSEDMFQQNTSTNAYIYFRHEFSHYNLVINAGNPEFKLPKCPKLTTKDITKKYLEEEFGFHGELKSIT